MKNNTAIHVIKNTILTSALLHLSILIFVAIKDKNIELLNGFNILDIDLIFPSVTSGTVSFLVSYVVIVGIAFFFFLRETNNKVNR